MLAHKQGTEPMSAVVQIKPEGSNEKHDKFVKLAKSRVSRALNSIRLIGNLSNRQTYEYSDAEIKKIEIALRNVVEQVIDQFSATEKPTTEFDF